MAEIFDFGLQKYKIKMDSRYFDNILSAVAGDTGRRIEVQLLDTNGMVQNTNGLILRLNAVVEGKATYTNANLVDASTGKYQLDLSNGMFLVPGDWQFQWQIIDSAGKKIHSFAFTGRVGINISEGGNQATNFYLNAEELRLKTIELQTDFDKLGTQFKKIIDETTGKDVISAPEIIAARKGETSLNARLTKNEQETTAQLAQKATKGEIGITDLDKNKIKYDETWFSDSVKQQWAGNTPVNATPPDGGVTTAKLANKAVTKDKMSITPVSGTQTTNLYNRNIAMQGIYYESGQGVESVNANYEAIKLIPVEPNTTYVVSHPNQIVLRDKDGYFISGKNLSILGVNTFTTTSATRFVSISIPKNVSNVYQIQKGTILTSFEPYGTKNTDLIINNKTVNDFVIELNEKISETNGRLHLKQLMTRIIQEKLRVKLLGDSITAGLGGTGYAQDGEYINSGFYVNETGHCWANSFRDYMLEKFNVVVKNFGQSGTTTRHITSGFDSLVKAEDDVVFVMIGTNNRGLAGHTLADYYNDLILIGDKIKALGKEIVFMSSIPASVSNEATTGKLFHMEDVDNTIMQVSNHYNSEYISLYKSMVEYCELTGVELDTLQADGLHPNDNGYDIMFRAFCHEMGIGVKRTGATW